MRKRFAVRGNVAAAPRTEVTLWETPSQAPAGRWVVATGEASPPQADDRNSWNWAAIFLLAPEGARGLRE